MAQGARTKHFAQGLLGGKLRPCTHMKQVDKKRILADPVAHLYAQMVENDVCHQHWTIGGAPIENENFVNRGSSCFQTKCAHRPNFHSYVESMSNVTHGYHCLKIPFYWYL